ncbi:hypothetical protein [Psychrobacillus phage Spoks]|nr:hypothetical protein [Psychrobacillus phage Spoks]
MYSIGGGFGGTNNKNGQALKENNTLDHAITGGLFLSITTITNFQ